MKIIRVAGDTGTNARPWRSTGLASARRVSWQRFWFFTIPRTDISNRWRPQSPKALAPLDAQVEVKRVPETVPEDVARKSGFKLEPAGTDRHRRRAAAIRRDHLRHRHPLRQHDGADEDLHRPDRPPVGQRRAGRQGRLRCSHRRTPSTADRSPPSSPSTTVLLHLGFIIVGLPYAFQGQMGVE